MAKQKADNSYDASQIQVLEGLEATTNDHQKLHIKNSDKPKHEEVRVKLR